jgi:hypothetical protein
VVDAYPCLHPGKKHLHPPFPCRTTGRQSRCKCSRYHGGGTKTQRTQWVQAWNKHVKQVRNNQTWLKTKKGRRGGAMTCVTNGAIGASRDNKAVWGELGKEWRALYKRIESANM